MRKSGKVDNFKQIKQLNKAIQKHIQIQTLPS